MYPIKRTPLAAALLLALNSPLYSPVASATPAPTGPRAGTEFQVNTYTSLNQRFPHVAMDASGNYVVVWADYGGEDGDSAGIFAQRYNADGTTAGNEFQVNTWTTAAQTAPSVAMDGQRRFCSGVEDRLPVSFRNPPVSSGPPDLNSMTNNTGISPARRSPNI